MKLHELTVTFHCTEEEYIGMTDMQREMYAVPGMSLEGYASWPLVQAWTDMRETARVWMELRKRALDAEAEVVNLSRLLYPEQTADIEAVSKAEEPPY